MGNTIAPANITLDPTGRIAQDVYCIHCGYNLRSLLADRACPECNQPVGESLRGDLLQFSNPTWLKKLSSGMGWMLFSGIFSLVVGNSLNRFLWPWLIAARPSALAPTAITFGICTGLMNLVGPWKVTSPEPRLLDTQTGISVRTAARFLPIISLAFGWSMTSIRAVSPLSIYIVAMANSVISTIGAICLYILLARLARRLPASGLIRFTWAVCGLMVLVNVLSAFVQMLSLRLMRTPGAGPSPFSKWTWVFLMVSPISLASTILSLVLKGIYWRRFRKVMGLSQTTTHGSMRVGETSA